MGEHKGKRKLGRQLRKNVHFQSDKRPYDITFSQKKTVCFKLFSHHSYVDSRNGKALLLKPPRTRSKRKLSFAKDSFEVYLVSSFPALFVDPRVGISRSASMTDYRFYLDK